MPRPPGRVSLPRASWAPSRGSGPLPLGTDTPKCAVSAALLGMGARLRGRGRQVQAQRGLNLLRPSLSCGVREGKEP